MENNFFNYFFVKAKYNMLNVYQKNIKYVNKCKTNIIYYLIDIRVLDIRASHRHPSSQYLFISRNSIFTNLMFAARVIHYTRRLSCTEKCHFSIIKILSFHSHWWFTTTTIAVYMRHRSGILRKLRLVAVRSTRML